MFGRASSKVAPSGWAKFQCCTYSNGNGCCLLWNAVKYRIDANSLAELVLFLILSFGWSAIRNSWASALATASCTIREIVLFKSSNISTIYGIVNKCHQAMATWRANVFYFNLSKKFTFSNSYKYLEHS